MGWIGTRNTHDSKPIKVSMPPRVAKIKSRYSISPKILGLGKMATVYSASSHENPEEKVAIKVVNKVKINQKVSEVEKEIEVLKKLDHPNIVKYVEFYENEYNIYIVMELCSGGELSCAIKEKLRRSRLFTENEASETVGQLLSALNHCHSHGVIHGDLNPSNIMFDKNNQPKIIDFGATWSTDSDKTFWDNLNKHYSAPEIRSGGNAVKKSDVWSLGVILYVMLAGRFPFNDEKYTLNEKMWNEMSKDVVHLLKNMLKVDPSQRFSVKQWLTHRWISKDIEKENALNDNNLISEGIECLTSVKDTYEVKSTAHNSEVLNQGYLRQRSERMNKILKPFGELDTEKWINLDIDTLYNGDNQSLGDNEDERFHKIIKEIYDEEEINDLVDDSQGEDLGLSELDAVADLEDSLNLKPSKGNKIPILFNSS